MKNIRILLSAALLALAAAACYEDKGNYEYRDVNAITIRMDGQSDKNAPSFRITMGEKIELHPTITFVNGTGDMSRLEYKWTLTPNAWYDEENTYTQDDWNTLDFEWTPDFLIPNGRLDLCVTDRETGIQTFGQARCMVSSRYNALGAMILAEKEGVTQFSFIKGTSFDSNNIPSEFEIYDNVYFTENGEHLPDGPIKMVEHYCTDNSTSGQILILTRNGAVDIGGQDFRKDIDLREAFDGAAYPADFGYARDAMFLSRVDVVMDASGRVYSRLKNTADLFHSGYFLPDPAVLEGEREPLSECMPVPAPYNNICCCLLYDAAKRRFVLIADTGTGGWRDPEDQNANRLAPIANPTARPSGEAEQFLPLDNLGDEAEILSINCFRPNSYYSGMGYVIVFNRDGKTYFQEFVLNKDYGVFGYAAVDPAVYEIKGLPGKATFAYSQPYYKSSSYSNNPLLFCAVGSELYVYDCSNPSIPAIRYEPKMQDGTPAQPFGSDIVAMNAENFGSRWAVVALADGRVLVLKTQQANYPEEQIAYFDSADRSYGEVKCVLCKTGGANWVN